MIPANCLHGCHHYVKTLQKTRPNVTYSPAPYHNAITLLPPLLRCCKQYKKRPRLYYCCIETVQRLQHDCTAYLPCLSRPPPDSPSSSLPCIHTPTHESPSRGTAETQKQICTLRP
jgi:hypothetical protein